MSFSLWGPYAAGFVLAVILGHFITGIVLGGLMPAVSEKEKKKRADARRLSGAAAFLDRLLFFTALALGYPNFIGLWIVVKAALFLRKPPNNGAPRRLFPIETGLSVLLAAAGHVVAGQVRAAAYVEAGALSAVCLLAAFAGAAAAGKKRPAEAEGGRNT